MGSAFPCSGERELSVTPLWANSTKLGSWKTTFILLRAYVGPRSAPTLELISRAKPSVGIMYRSREQFRSRADAKKRSA